MTTTRCILYLSLATSLLFGCVGAGASGSSSDDEVVGGGFKRRHQPSSDEGLDLQVSPRLTT